MDLSSINRKDKDIYIPWFRNNYFQLKNDPKFKELFSIYYNHLTPEEKKSDLCIENYRLFKKIEEYKLYLTKSSEKYQKTIAENFVCVKNGIVSSAEICKSKYKNQVKSIKNAFAATLATVNQKAVNLNSTEIKTSIGYLETELSLILDDKWIGEYLNEYKKSMLTSLNQVLQKNLDKNDTTVIKSYLNKILDETTVNKSKFNLSNSTNENFFKTPDTLPPKSRKSVSNRNNLSGSINISLEDNNRSSESVSNRSCDNSEPKNTYEEEKTVLETNEIKIVTEKIESVVLIDSDLKEETSNRNISNEILPTENSPSESEKIEEGNCKTNRNRVSKESNLSKILEVSESSLDSHKSAENPIYSNSGSLGRDKSEISKIDNDMKHRMSLIESESEFDRKTLHKVDKSNDIDMLTLKGFNNMDFPLAESTKKHNLDSIKKNQISNDIGTIGSFMKHSPNAESTKKIPVDNIKKTTKDEIKNQLKIKEVDSVEEFTLKGLSNYPPYAESTKKINEKPIIDDIQSNNDFTLKGLSNYPPYAESTKKINEKPIIDNIQSDNDFTLKGLSNYPPYAESTKKNTVNDFIGGNIKKHPITVEGKKIDCVMSENRNNEKKPLNDIDTVKNFSNHPPAAESTKKIDFQNKVETIDFTDNLCTIKGFINRPPCAESTKIRKTHSEQQHKIGKITEEKIDFEDKFTLRNVNKFQPVAESTKLPNANQMKDRSKNTHIPKLMQFPQNRSQLNFDKLNLSSIKPPLGILSNSTLDPDCKENLLPTRCENLK